MVERHPQSTRHAGRLGVKPGESKPLQRFLLSALNLGMSRAMLRPPSETKVTQFLRDALVEDALGVPKLELMARAAGLLGEHQSISHMKAFKRAKKSLGIRSLRAGFGARSQWRWQLRFDEPFRPRRRLPGCVGRHGAMNPAGRVSKRNLDIWAGYVGTRGGSRVIAEQAPGCGDPQPG
jgi:hypothetical protein